MPAHSDDEVTPRRGLEEQMSESRLRQLDEEVGSGYPDDSRVVHPLSTGLSKPQAWRSSLARDQKPPRQNHDGMSSIDLNEREEMEVSVDLDEHELTGRTPGGQSQPATAIKVTPAANKQMTTPRLFLGLETTGRGAEKSRKPGGEDGGKDAEENKGSMARSEDDDSACNLIESSRSMRSMQEAFDAARGNCRYQPKDCETPFDASAVQTPALAEQYDSMLMGSQIEPRAHAPRGMLPASKLFQPKPKVNKGDLKSIENWVMDR